MPANRKPAQGYTFWSYRIPDHMAPALEAWISKGKLPGDFLQALLRNDLRGTIERGDAENIANLKAYIGYLYNEAPGACWGSPEKVEAWAARFADAPDLPEHSIESPEEGLLSNLPHDA